jgi:cobaltochelatase CobT
VAAAAGPFAPRTVEAVSACTRTLAGTDDVDVSTTRAAASTVGALRAYADRTAIGRRFHDATVHRRHAPKEEGAARLFNQLEQGRLDARGAAWLRGVAHNLLAYPGTDADGLRWLCFELCSGLPAPPEKTVLVGRLRQELSPTLLSALTTLAGLAADHSAFAEAAARWVNTAHKAVPAADPPTPGPHRVPLPTRVVEHRRRREKGPAHRRPDGDAEGAGPGAGGGQGSAEPAEVELYKAYTTAHDRVVSAAALANRDELAALRKILDKDLTAMRVVVARLAKRLMRVLMARQLRQWRFDLDEGLLDGSRLAPFIASSGATRPFKQEAETTFPSTVVSLLIDHSGSMRGRPMQIAALTVEIFARVLERCGVHCEVLGFTTRDWDGGEPAREWAADGYPDAPGRLNALEHVVVKPADVPWRRARVALGLFMRDEMLKENIDGEAVEWAYRRLRARRETRKILVVVSDGTPMDEATLAANGHEYLDLHLRDVVNSIEREGEVQLAAIGVGVDVSQFYSNTTRIAGIEELGPALTNKLVTLLDASPRNRFRRRS